MDELIDLGFNGYIEFDAGEWLEYAATEVVNDPENGTRYSVLNFLDGEKGMTRPVPMIKSDIPWKKVAEIYPDDPLIQKTMDEICEGIPDIVIVETIDHMPFGEGNVCMLRIMRNYMRTPENQDRGLKYYIDQTEEYAAKLRREDALARRPKAKVLLFHPKLSE